MLAPSGSVYSVDAWLRRKFSDKLASRPKLQWLFPPPTPSVSANVATRLLQIHLCIIYLFGGLAKARGESWWDGTAVWFAVGNLEYQSVDMTWLANYPRIFSALSHTTMFWEIFYCALIWPKVTRPIVLAIAIGIHGGIALFMGMATFGLMMIAANVIFVPPEWLLAWRKSTAPDLEKTDSSDWIEDTADSGLSDAGLSGLLATPQTPLGIADDQLSARAEKIDVAADKLREKHAKLKARHEKMKVRERKYKQRVKRLKKREAKIKAYIKRRREAREQRAASKSETPEQD